MHSALCKSFLLGLLLDLVLPLLNLVLCLILCFVGFTLGLVLALLDLVLDLVLAIFGNLFPLVCLVLEIVARIAVLGVVLCVIGEFLCFFEFGGEEFADVVGCFLSELFSLGSFGLGDFEELLD